MYREYLESKRWVRKEDDGKIVYSRGTATGDFFSIGKRNYLGMDTLVERTRGHFASRGYPEMPAKSVVSDEETLFIGAGVQAVMADPPAGAVFLAQPSVRMHALERIGRPGYSTSFTNICTEEVNASPEAHLSHLEEWFTYLSSLGIYINHLKLVENPTWGNGHVGGASLLVYYGGMQLGDAVYVDRWGGHTDPISDIGFGLERVAWAVAKYPNYFEGMASPLTLAAKPLQAIDALRTLTLMAMCGVETDNRGPGYRMRQLVQAYDRHTADLYPLHDIEEFSSFWGRFYPDTPRGWELEQKVLKELQKPLKQYLGRTFKMDAEGTLDACIRKMCAVKGSAAVDEKLRAYQESKR